MKLQIPPLRSCGAPVGMTREEGLLTFDLAIRMGRPQISPLRCAPVEMTKGRAVLPARVVAEQDSFLFPPDRSSPRRQTAKFVQQLLFLEASPLPFVISTGAKRSGEISVWMLFLGNAFLANRSGHWRDLQCAFTLESTDEWTVSGQDRCGHGCRAGHWTSNRNCICGRRSHGVGY